VGQRENETREAYLERKAKKKERKEKRAREQKDGEEEALSLAKGHGGEKQIEEGEGGVAGVGASDSALVKGGGEAEAGEVSAAWVEGGKKKKKKKKASKGPQGQEQVRADPNILEEQLRVENEELEAKQRELDKQIEKAKQERVLQARAKNAELEAIMAEKLKELEALKSQNVPVKAPDVQPKVKGRGIGRGGGKPKQLASGPQTQRQDSILVELEKQLSE
jgi:hypothetical protein